MATCTVSGKCINPNGSTITNGVVVQAFDTSGNPLCNTTSVATGHFTLPPINNSLGTVNLTFSRNVIITTGPPQLTMNGVSVTGSTNNLGNVTIPT